LRNKLRDNGYDYILSDRYFYDSMINIEYLCHSEAEPKNLEILLRQLADQDDIKPDIAIYLQNSPENIMQRERKPDQGMDYLKKKKELYDAKISQWNMQVIDGDRDKNIIFEEICRKI
jgi:thymidylate kinase